MPPEWLDDDDGPEQLLQFLPAHLLKECVPAVGTEYDQFLHKTRRWLGEAMGNWVMRYNSARERLRKAVYRVEKPKGQLRILSFKQKPNQYGSGAGSWWSKGRGGYGVSWDDSSWPLNWKEGSKA